RRRGRADPRRGRHSHHRGSSPPIATCPAPLHRTLTQGARTCQPAPPGDRLAERTSEIDPAHGRGPKVAHPPPVGRPGPSVVDGSVDLLALQELTQDRVPPRSPF